LLTTKDGRRFASIQRRAEELTTFEEIWPVLKADFQRLGSWRLGVDRNFTGSWKQVESEEP
jgi:hypothetical protein